MFVCARNGGWFEGILRAPECRQLYWNRHDGYVRNIYHRTLTVNVNWFSQCCSKVYNEQVWEVNLHTANCGKLSSLKCTVGLRRLAMSCWDDTCPIPWGDLMIYMLRENLIPDPVGETFGDMKCDFYKGRCLFISAGILWKKHHWINYWFSMFTGWISDHGMHSKQTVS